MGLAAKIPGWERIRRAVLDRDGWRCTECGKAGRLEVHHLVALRDGGNNDLANLAPVCIACHKAIHRRPTVPEQDAWGRVVAEILR